MKRIKPKPEQRTRLLKASAFRCCVCKRAGIGFNIHHIDGDASRTVDSNLAVLCVEDHDHHHRPGHYEDRSNHLELDAKEILRLKNSWEAFVAEAQKPAPQLLATLACYGTRELVHSVQLVLQWPDERIEHKRSFHLLDDGNHDRITDLVLKELASISSTIKLAVVSEPLPVEHCPCCGVGFSRTMKPAVVARLTDPDWATQSSCCIYINPTQPSLALVFFLRHEQLLAASLHLCQGSYLHYACEGIDDRAQVEPTPSVRAQAAAIVRHVLREWAPANVTIGTGDPDTPTVISELKLPKVWEKTAESTRSRGPIRR